MGINEYEKPRTRKTTRNKRKECGEERIKNKNKNKKKHVKEK